MNASCAERGRVFKALCLLQKTLPPDTFSFARQKRTRKAPATFEAREARTRGCSPLVTPKQKSKRKNASRFAQTGCGAQRPLRALSGTRVLLTAAPTAPPCFRRWRRSSPLHFFLASPVCRPLSRCATAPRRGASASRCRLPLRPLP